MSKVSTTLQLMRPDSGGWATAATLTVTAAGALTVTGDREYLPITLPALLPGGRVVRFADDPAEWARHLHSRLRSGQLVPVVTEAPGWDDATRAETLASEQLMSAGLVTRWEHAQATAAAMAADAPLHVVQAAWLHDVGYNPALVDSGLAALDGATWLRHLGAPGTVVDLVAWHTTTRDASQVEQLHRFARPPAADSELLLAACKSY